MIVQGKDLKRLLRGAVVTLTCERDRGLHAGRSYAVQRSGGKPQIARMDCLECFQDEFGWHYKVRLSKEVPPRLLAQRSELGYTSDRHRALKDEPEAPPKSWEDDHARAIRGRATLTRLQIIEERLEACRTFEHRLVTTWALARSHGVDVRSERRVADKMWREGKIEKLQRLAVRVEDKIRKEAA